MSSQNTQTQKTTTRKVVFEGHYKTPDMKEGYKDPLGNKHMFTRGTSSTGKWMPHIGVGALKSCVNGAINEALREIGNGGYITIEVTVVNP